MDSLEEALQAAARYWVAEHRDEIQTGRRNPWTMQAGFAGEVALQAEAAMAEALKEAGLR